MRHLAGDQTKFPVYIAGVFKSDSSHIPGTEGRGTAAPVQYRSFTPAADGAHYVEVAVERTNFTQTGSYEISAETLTLPEDDILANSSTTGVISVGGEVTKEVDVPGDEDWFKVNLTKSDLDFYRVDVYSGNTESTRLANPYLWGVFHPDGHLLPDTVNSYTSWTQSHPNAYFAVEKTGNYYIAVGSTGGTGEYRVGLTKITDDFSAGTSTTGTVAVDGSTTGNSQWEFEDSDWFKVALTGGTEYTISVKGKISNSTTHGTLWGPIIYALRDASGNKISGTFAKGTSSTYPSITYTATATGDHYIDVRNPGGTGTYTVSVSD